MTEKVKLTREQADAIDTLNKTAKGMKVVDLLRAIQEGYEVEPEYSIGDLVVRTRTVAGRTRDETYEEGYTFKIYGVQGGHLLDNLSKKHLVESIRHATPEEIKAEKERRLWKSIEREVGSFKIGDCYSYGGSQMEITTDRILETAEIRYRMGKVEGFYPAESFISFEVKSND